MNKNLGIPHMSPTIPRFIFKIPRVVPNQRLKFQTDVLFRQLSLPSKVLYTGHMDCSMDKRRTLLVNGCRNGHIDLVFTNTGTNVQLFFEPNVHLYQECGFIKFLSSLIMDGVCVRFRGWIEVESLEGVGALEYNEELAVQEDAILRQ